MVLSVFLMEPREQTCFNYFFKLSLLRDFDSNYWLVKSLDKLLRSTVCRGHSYSSSSSGRSARISAVSNNGWAESITLSRNNQFLLQFCNSFVSFILHPFTRFYIEDLKRSCNFVNLTGVEWRPLLDKECGRCLCRLETCKRSAERKEHRLRIVAKNVVRDGTGLLAHSVLNYTVLLDFKHPRGTSCVNDSSNFIKNVSLYVSYFSTISMRAGI